MALLIAATAQTHAARLFTRNINDFLCLDDLVDCFRIARRLETLKHAALACIISSSQSTWVDDDQPIKLSAYEMS
jgi:hypothetical protein